MEQPSKNTLIRYFKGECTPAEIELVALYLAMDVDPELVATCMKAAWLDEKNDAHLQVSEADLTDFKQRFYAKQNKLISDPIVEEHHIGRGQLFQFPIWMKVAAVLLILMSITLFTYNKQPTVKSELAKIDVEVAPGSDKALLTLADGSTISLSDTHTGKLAMQGGLQVEKTATGEVVYSGRTKIQHAAHVTNTITTPRGGQYRVTLPDGTKAWLNAASSLSYPLRFKEGERRVKMTGEVYFEVAKAILNSNRKHVPFFVETDKQTVQVLGTHFNVSAYADEPAVKTTLLEGSVKIISRQGDAALLQPGQLALLTEHIQVKEADVDQELAWKNGDFIFKGETLESALRKVARWYDVEIVCPPNLGKLRFNGMISRSQPLSMIAEMIQLTKLGKVTVKERRFIVTN